MIGKEVRRRREELGLTGAQLAARAGMAPSAVSQIETGRRTPSSTSVIKLAAALNIDAGDLYPKAQAPLPLEVAEQAGHAGSDVSKEGRRLINALAPAVVAALKGWETYLEHLPGQPTAEVWKKESERIKELLGDASKMYDAIEEHGILEAMEPYVDAIDAGESVPQPLRRNVIGLYNALAALFSYTIPKANNWASRFWERVQSEDIDRRGQEWAAKERIPELGPARKND